MTLNKSRLNHIRALHAQSLSTLNYGQALTARESAAVVEALTDLLADYTNTHRSHHV